MNLNLNEQGVRNRTVFLTNPTDAKAAMGQLNGCQQNSYYLQKEIETVLMKLISEYNQVIWDLSAMQT